MIFDPYLTPLRLNTGGRKGTVLSPFLFTLYTLDFTYSTDSCHLQKFSNDTAIVGCVSEGNDCEYRKVIMDFVDWCELNHLQVNASKTKEMVIDFSRKPSSEIAPVNIQGLDISLEARWRRGNVRSPPRRWTSYGADPSSPVVADLPRNPRSPWTRLLLNWTASLSYGRTEARRAVRGMEEEGWRQCL
ncbi:hypothetical protein L3Q82_014613 [Scortum barcoo]|uniref:Uncharacterized protein n=1 Tax=Scortum barcoo TaxID=214431 RepID=A0ACB8VXX7_9TELE|nr:hypothetical protein L3Q82_014613 [Scortum barcoo]